MRRMFLFREIIASEDVKSFPELFRSKPYFTLCSCHLETDDVMQNLGRENDKVWRRGEEKVFIVVHYYFVPRRTV